MKKILPVIILLSVILGAVTIWQIRNSHQSRKLEKALTFAGDNRTELEKVVDYYRDQDKNRFKQKAAEFLISNCYIHSHEVLSIMDLDGSPVRFYPPDYDNPYKVRKEKERLIKEQRLNRQIHIDCQELSASYLINHIDGLYEIWNDSPWNEVVEFNRFCQDILPYRVQNEPLSNWVELLHQRYNHIIDTLSSKNIVSASEAINSAISDDVAYNNCWVGGLGPQSVSGLLENKTGMCDDLSVYGVCAMRACGIPAVLDFTIWGKTDYGHSWGVVFDEQNKSWSFSPGEYGPREYKKVIDEKTGEKMAKVFRRTFHIEDDCLAAIAKDISMLPPFFRQMNISDVTSEYIPIHSITLELKVPAINEDYLYLCIYNSGRWIPIHWAIPKNNKVTFNKMGGGILYYLASYNGYDLEMIGDPFIYWGEEKFTILNVIHETRIPSATIAGWVIGLGPVKENQKHEVYRWMDKDWKLQKTILSNPDSTITLENLSRNALYKLGGKSRPFTIEGNKVQWW